MTDELVKLIKLAERKTLYAELLKKALDAKEFEIFDFICKCEEEDK